MKNNILKLLDYVAGFYNKLPKEQKLLRKSNVNVGNKVPLQEKKSKTVDKKIGKPSKRKGEQHSDETIFNTPRR